MTGHNFHPTVLRAYDVRGIVGETLHAADARALGRAFGTVLVRKGGRTIAVGYDGRLSSPELEAALVEGLVSTGLRVRRIGLGPTPMLYFAVHELGTDAGIMVTGSHNPPTHNGFKMMMGHGPFFADDIVDLGKLAAAGDFITGTGRVETVDLIDAYIARLIRGLDLPSDIAVAWDIGNGAAGTVVPRLIEKLKGRHVLLNEVVDGNFPAHHPDPTVPENLVQVIETVARERCDFGIAFDGDADRLGVVDSKGRILWGDQLMALLARDVLAKYPGAVIIGDVKCSSMLFDEVKRLGGTPLIWSTGHSHIKKKMKELGAKLGGEMSAHIFFADDFYGHDDAIYAGLRLLQVLKRSGKRLDALRDELPEMVNTPEMRFDCADTRKFIVVDEVLARLRKAGADFNNIDGARVNTPDGWWLLRASNTQAVLVARCEAKDQAGLARLKGQLAAQLKASGVDATVITGH